MHKLNNRVILLLFRIFRISVPAPANPKSGHFSEIQPSLAEAKFLAGFGKTTMELQYVQLITGETNAADLHLLF